MVAQTPKDERRKTIVCLDSYHSGIPKGWICAPYQEAESFECLSQFLIKMEFLLDNMQMPQSYTATRTFHSTAVLLDRCSPPFHVRRGAKATFEVHVIFRQHTSWQGVIIWLEHRLEQSFRSVLELVLLMDSALRTAEGSDTA